MPVCWLFPFFCKGTVSFHLISIGAFSTHCSVSSFHKGFNPLSCSSNFCPTLLFAFFILLPVTFDIQQFLTLYDEI